MSQPPQTPAPHLDPDGLPPLWDAGNTLLPAAPEPATLVIGQVPAGGGAMGVATIRTRTTTLTLMLDERSAGEWEQTFGELRRALGGGTLVVPKRGEAMAIADAARHANGHRRAQ